MSFDMTAPNVCNFGRRSLSTPKDVVDRQTKARAMDSQGKISHEKFTNACTRHKGHKPIQFLAEKWTRANRPTVIINFLI